LSRDEAEKFARKRLAFLAGSREPGGHNSWDVLAQAAAWALAGDHRGVEVFRRVFDDGFASSASGMEVGYAALGLGLLGDAESIDRVSREAMAFNGIDEALAAARVLLGC
jgi:hypothetical protein